jgi:hypothetical protein
MLNRPDRKWGTLFLIGFFGLVAFGFASRPSRTAAEEDPIPQSVTLENDFVITFIGVTPATDGTSTWTYNVAELPAAKDLSNWVLETPFCAPILDAGPEPWEIVDPDPNALLSGIKWETGDSFEQGEFWVQLDTSGQSGVTNVAAKGPDVAWGEIAGPSCVEGEPPVDPPPVDPPGDPGDEEPPTVEWISPVKQFGTYDVLQNSSTTLLVEATDNVHVARVEYLRWDAVQNTFVTIAVDKVEPYQQTVFADELNPTWNQVFAASFDNAGNQSDWEWIWIYKVVSGPLFQPPNPKLFIPLVIR